MTQTALRERVRRLKDKWPAYQPLLDFYCDVREAQEASKKGASMANEAAQADPSRPANPKLVRIGDEGFPIDIEASARLFSELCQIGALANPHFASEVDKIELRILSGDVELESLLNSDSSKAAIAQAASDTKLDQNILTFLVSNSVRPSVEMCRDRCSVGFEANSWRKPCCPICGSLPTLSLLEGEPVLRFSLCSQCGFRWPVDRLACSVCGSKDPDARSYFYGEGDTANRIDLCESCHHYIKTIDVRPLGWTDPYLEDLATLHLDVVAAEKGYARAVPNPWTA